MSRDGTVDQVLLQGIYLPFDAKAWERFREWDMEAAARLEAAVAGGLTPDAVADYGRQHGYSDAAVNWLRHATAYLRHLRDADPAGDGNHAVSGRRGRRITDADLAEAKPQLLQKTNK